MATQLRVACQHESSLGVLASIFAAAMPQPVPIFLAGRVGAGKTVFCRSFVRSKMGNSTMDVPSPSFTIANSYADATGNTRVQHIDLYRLGTSTKQQLDFLDLPCTFKEQFTLMEWPQMMPDEMLPEDYLGILLDDDPSDSSVRLLQGHAVGGTAPARAASKQVLAQVRQALQQAAQLGEGMGPQQDHMVSRMHATPPDAASFLLRPKLAGRDEA